MKKVLKLIVLQLACMFSVILFIGCDVGSLLSEDLIDPVGEWRGEQEGSDTNKVVLSYTFTADKYRFERSISGIVDYGEEGSWIISSDNVFKYTPTSSYRLNSNSGNLEEVTAGIQYTAVYYGKSFGYYYWDSNSEFMIIDIKKL